MVTREVVPRRPEDDRSPPGPPHPSAPWVSDGTEDPRGEPTGAPPTAARALLHLLRATALVTGGGRAALLHTLFAFTVSSLGTAGSTRKAVHDGIELLRRGETTLALATSGFFGLLHGMMWISVVCCFLSSRRQCEQQLVTIRSATYRLSKLSGISRPSDSLNWKTNGLFAIVLLLVLVMIAATGFHIVYQPGGCLTISMNCVLTALYLVTFCWFGVTFCLIPVKFVLASLYVESGLQEINTLLTAMVEGHYQPDPAAVCDVISLHGELSRTFGLLTKVMSAELVLVMASGTIACVTILLTVVSSVTMGAFGDMALMVALYLMMASVTMVLPSEAVHRCLEAAGEARELLLAAELRQPRLSLQLGLLRESVSRDLDTLGELGLFRLRRSTVLSIGATILTNAIIMLQFYFA